MQRIAAVPIPVSQAHWPGDLLMSVKWVLRQIYAYPSSPSPRLTQSTHLKLSELYQWRSRSLINLPLKNLG